jgi:hypothetical protein
MYISPQNLTARLKNSKSLLDLRQQANEHSSIMSALLFVSVVVVLDQVT